MTKGQELLPSWISNRGNGYYSIDLDAAKEAGEELPIELGRFEEFNEFFTNPPTKAGTIDFLANNQSSKLFYQLPKSSNHESI